MAVLKEELTRPPASLPRNGNGGRMVLPKEFVPGPNCVICGRGKACSSNPGNKRLKELIDSHLKIYSEAKSKVEKSAIVSKIVETIKQSSPDGAFVKFEQGVWYEVEESVSREKIGSMLRDLLHTQYRSSSKAKLARRKANRAHHMMMMPADPSWLANNLQRNLMLGSGGLDYSNHTTTSASLDYSNHTHSTSLEYSSSSLNFSNHSHRNGLDYSNHSHRNGLDFSNHSVSLNISNHGLNVSNHGLNVSNHGGHRNSLDFSNHSSCSNLDYSNHERINALSNSSNHGSSNGFCGGNRASINNELNSSVHSACGLSYSNHSINAPIYVQDEVSSFPMMNTTGRIETCSQAPCSPNPIGSSQQQQQQQQQQQKLPPKPAMSGFAPPMQTSCMPNNIQEQPSSRSSMLRSLMPMKEHLGIMGASAKDVPTKSKPRNMLERILEHGYDLISTSARSLLSFKDDDDDVPPPVNTSSANNNTGEFVVDTTTTAPCLPAQNGLMNNVNAGSSAAAAAAAATSEAGDEVLPAEFYNLFGGCAMSP